MTIRNYSILTGITAAAILALWALHPREVQGGASSTPPATTSTTVPAARTPDTPNPPPSATPRGNAPVSLWKTIDKTLDSEKDHLALAKRMLPLAKEGNPEAQVTLFQAYRVCTMGSNADHFKQYDTLEKVRQMAIDNAAYGISVAAEEARFQRCHGFYTDEAKSLGDPWDWLRKATDAGYAPAQALTAKLRLTQDILKAQLLAGGPDQSVSLDPMTTIPALGGVSTPRELLVAAAQSGDPYVLAEIAEEQFLLHPGQPRNVTDMDEIAWYYAACQRGFDCSGYGPSTVVNCAPTDRCTPVPNDFLKRVNNNWAPVQDRVNQINAALATKQWDQLPGLSKGG